MLCSDPEGKQPGAQHAEAEGEEIIGSPGQAAEDYPDQGRAQGVPTHQRQQLARNFTKLITIITSLPYFGVKLSCVCLMFAYRKKSNDL